MVSADYGDIFEQAVSMKSLVWVGGRLNKLYLRLEDLHVSVEAYLLQM